ncbi:MAG: ECF transporter S component [Oscillospiraceae bacterium]|nr:ECF transporter S component [Oscillospiraceae bacterium]
MTNNKSKISWIARTAVFIALLIVMQAVTAAFGNTLVTGSVVNLMLILSVMTCGPLSGICVAVVSPVMAKLLGIGPLWSLIPVIIAGNTVLVLLWHFIGNRSAGKKYMRYLIALVTAAAAKFAVLYFGVVKIVLPILTELPERQVSVISGMFSFPQLITASIGGALAITILPILRKAAVSAKLK